jgi:tRNA modification GTPase
VLSQLADPIAAVATAPGRGAVGIVRVSGPDLKALVQALFGKSLRPREATYLPFKDAQGQPIDHGLALYFEAPHSYTGEDVLELQAHGGAVVLQLLLARCLELGQQLGWPLRLAQPGEFTRRAFLNDKLDLAQAEAVADLIDASTEAAARSAARSLGGEFSQHIQHLLDRLTHLRMLVEATLDFPEEEIDHLQAANAQGQLDALVHKLAHILSQAQQGALLREGLTVVIAGQPNVGKSSLLNALAGAELAIVTPIAGTTRDKVTQTIQIEGVPVHVVDTAGLRSDSEAQDEVERIGIQRAWGEIRAADALLFLHDLSRQHQADYQTQEATLAAQLPQGLARIDVFNKCDLNAGEQREQAQQVTTHAQHGEQTLALTATTSETTTSSLYISAKTGEGLAALRQRLLQLAGWQSLPESNFIARQRHVEALTQVQTHLETAQSLLALQAQSLDLLAEELRLAQLELSKITGEFSADDLLGVIFSSFCIGK